jgi:hypothetical protein
MLAAYTRAQSEAARTPMVAGARAR